MRKTHTRARSAQSLLRYHVLAGHIVRPSACEQCGATGRRIEAAHFDYAEPLRVRWLCVPCHRRWDAAVPKGATYRVTEPSRLAGVEPRHISRASPHLIRRFERVTGATAERVTG